MAVVIAVTVKDLMAHAEDALVVLIRTDMLEKFLESGEGQLVVGAVAVVRTGLVFHAVDQGGESLEAGRASVVRAREVFVALFRRAVVCVATDSTVEAIQYLLSTRALDFQLCEGRGVADIPVSMLLVVL